ncbi:MAG: VWA domain-containing protein [Anaerolineae bacterium]|nr:VWA domain-containing protein [Anaerolineae bacterium]
MTFIWPPMLLLLVLVPVLVALYVRVQQRRRRLIASYGGSMLKPSRELRGANDRRHIPPLFFLIGLTILIFALARPETVVGVPRIEGTVILAFDISGSMAADDLEPTRLEAAKAAAQAFVERQPPSVRIGVVAFSDSGLAIQQPTYNQEDILAAIRRLDPARGTSLGNGMIVSLDVIEARPAETNFYSNPTPQPTPSPTPVPAGTYQAGVIVMLTDGENTDAPDPLEVAQAAADRGVRIYPIGIGSPTGTVLNIEGFNVFTQLDEALLREIAGRTGGTYFNAASAEELLDIYDNLDREFVITPEPMEITPLLAGLSILMLLTGGVLSMLWFGRVP